MSNSTTEVVKAPTKNVSGTVEGVNKDGVKLAGRWHNYGYTFKGGKLAKDDIGKEVELVLVESKKEKEKDGSPKWFIRSVTKAVAEVPAAPAAPEAEAPAVQEMPSEAKESDAAKPGAPSVAPEILADAESRILAAGITSSFLEETTKGRFGKPFGSLSLSELARTLIYFGA